MIIRPKRSQGSRWQDLLYLLKRHRTFYRIRYVLIARIVEASDLKAAIVHAEPADRIPSEFRDRVAQIDVHGKEGFQAALRIAYDLSHGHMRGPGLGLSSVSALKVVYGDQARGVCSDYSQLFVGLCRAAGIPVREWGVTDSLLEASMGHTFCEVFDSRHGQWVFLDPFHSLYFSDGSSQKVLALETMIDRLTAEDDLEFEMQVIDREISQDGILKRRKDYVHRYLNRDNFFFLMGNNDIFKQDSFLERLRILPQPLVHFLMILAGVYQTFNIYVNEHNQAQVRYEIRHLRIWFWRMMAITVGLMIAVLLSLLLLLRLLGMM